MATIAQEQAASLTPPRKSLTLAVAVDATARPYDITGLAFGEQTPEAAGKERVDVFLTLQADGGDVFYYFDTATSSTLDDTAKISAGSSLAYTATHCAKIKQDDRHEVRIDRAKDKFLVIKTSTGTAILRLWASSMASQ